MNLIADALAHNTTVTELLLDNANLENAHGILLAKALEVGELAWHIVVLHRLFSLSPFLLSVVAKLSMVMDRNQVLESFVVDPESMSL